MRKTLVFLAFGLASLVAILVVRTVLLVPEQIAVDPVTDIVVDVQVVADHLRQAIRFRTVSPKDSCVKFYYQLFRNTHLS